MASLPSEHVEHFQATRKSELKLTLVFLSGANNHLVSEKVYIEVCQEMFERFSEICDTFSTFYCTDTTQICQKGIQKQILNI